MSADVINLNAERSRTTVEMLEALLAEAKAGKVRAVAIAALGSEERLFTGHADADQGVFTLLGALREVEYSILSEVVEH